jgi:hypothetical protein
MPLQEILGGAVGMAMLTGEAVSAAEEDGSDEETSLWWKKVLQNRLPS